MLRSSIIFFPHGLSIIFLCYPASMHAYTHTHTHTHTQKGKKKRKGSKHTSSSFFSASPVKRPVSSKVTP